MASLTDTKNQTIARSDAFLTERSKVHSSNPLYHVHTIYLFSRDNIKDIICMGFLFGALNASVAQKFSMGASLSPKDILTSSHKMLLWSWSNLFLFNLHNQRHAATIAEDAINKPWRPLPAGRINSKQTTQIMYIMYAVIITVSFKVGGLIPCLLEALFCLWYNEWGGATDPFMKNLLNGLGFACFFAGPLEAITGYSVFGGNGKAAAWVGILAAAITTTSHTQDFRDMEGDKAVGRRTVPLVIGDYNARILVAVGVIVWTGLAGWYWGVGWKGGLAAWIAGGAMVSNLFWDRSQAGDAFTWKLWPGWALGLFLMPVIGA
ncbi:UbiA prenyltransferase family-domain-containing protein [Hypoxylon trugodes]|uniref:UbiA prenyltransferase family-domain-containing protein n=1 Tax=Hypoxylon trugodes TaxID=326681 RepID=UPI002199E594|nr:UbiA prenyltransferase family-domain-containing protein [Hypoxylon trugodes]KAI1385851.1 UbiA prenyltransferase family-domain-containing protein [Hypoxylon trugodes]